MSHDDRLQNLWTPACAPASSKKAKFCASKLWALCFNFEFYGTLWAALVKSADQRLFRRTWHVDIRAGAMGVFSNVSVVRRLRDFSPVRRVRRPDRASARANFPRVRTHDCLVDSALCQSVHGP